MPYGRHHSSSQGTTAGVDASRRDDRGTTVSTFAVRLGVVEVDHMGATNASRRVPPLNTMTLLSRT